MALLLLGTALILVISAVFLFNQQVKLFILVLKFVSIIGDVITLPFYLSVHLLIDRSKKTKNRSDVVQRHYEPNGDYHYWECEKKKTKKLFDEHQKLRDRLQNLGHLSELLAIVREVHKDKNCLGAR